MTLVSDAMRERLLTGQISEILLAIGGEHRAEGWIRIDGDTDLDPDIIQDLSEGLPFIENSVSAVYCGQLLTFLSLPVGMKLLQNCFRVLKPGAPLRLAVPDLVLFAERYVSGDERFFAVDYASEGGPWNGSITESFLTALYGWGRQCAYDYHLLEMILGITGFAQVTRSSHGESRYSQFCAGGLDQNPKQTLFIETQKPFAHE